MPEWLIERGIAETRALLVEGGQVRAARMHWPGEIHAGMHVRARLLAKAAPARRGTARLESGEEMLVDGLPASASEGAEIDLLITRAPMAERGRLKRARAKWIEPGARARGETSDNCDPLAALGRVVRRFPASLWEDVWDSAAQGSLDFAGGSLLLSVTPAMVLIDIDGEGTPRELALAACPAIARAIGWFDLGGSIGIDFPTIEQKSARKSVDEALGAALAGFAHERTAMNGFGFVQLVARLEGPSLLHRMTHARIAAAARMALRRGEMLEGPGALQLAVHPAIEAELRQDWLDQLARRSGREVRVKADPALAIEAPQAQLVKI